jgi:hypothetical protein
MDGYRERHASKLMSAEKVANGHQFTDSTAAPTELSRTAEGDRPGWASERFLPRAEHPHCARPISRTCQSLRAYMTLPGSYR